MRYAIIDIGSNTVKVSVYELTNRIHHLFSQSTTVSLATYRSDHVLSVPGIVALSDALSEYKSLAQTVSCDHIVCLATAGLRSLLNAEAVIEAVRSATGLTIEIISGEREAALAFSGLCSVISHPEDGLLLDMGGASTEIITIRDEKPTEAVSLNFGALKLYHHFVSSLIPTSEETVTIQEHVKCELRTRFPVLGYTGQTAYLTGGTAKAVAKLMRMDDVEQGGRTFSVTELKALRDRLRDSSFLHRAAARIPERMHMMPPGLLAMLEIFDHFQIQRVEVVYSGIRDGYIFERSQETI